MNKNKLLKVVNPVLAVSFIMEAVTGIMMAAGKGSKTTFEIHKHNGVLLIILVAAHLYLNWDWIKASFFRKTAKVK